VPALFQHYLEKLDLEIWFNHAKLFIWAAALYAAAGALLFVPRVRSWPLSRQAMLVVPALVLHIVGFGIRVYITQFAPVTNMYGTMLWVAFGVALFCLPLLWLYRSHVLVSVLLLGSSLVLILTEGFPLVLSPSMDPIVAVLRSNFWLTLHVLTITISYAGFTIAMLIGNYVIIKSIISKPGDEFYRSAAHAVYRMVQLGVFLLTAGIILGGVWADYSWGRFWGWDPKETWALIADVGYLIILHARYLGWLGPVGVLVSSTAAYLLVIMAWYGVNFVLAAGLHSYGFSSGGTALVATYVAIQMVLILMAFVQVRKRASPSPR
jgi:ABC-type transport system involved in cytochrome c biogenesis permease subunit